ncbi:MAG: hypothetical protein SF162_11095 [bacterium]|nr:hypothetical protein [bacterium]
MIVQFSLRRWQRTGCAFVLVCALVALAACDGEVPTPIPTRTLSGPTLGATEIFRPDFPTPEPFNPGMSSATAMGLPRDSELPPLVLESGSSVQTIQLTAGDGTLLNGDLYINPGGERVPGVLLIAPSRAAWGDLPLRLTGRGYTVLSMDLRPGAPLGDAITMLAAMANTPGVDPARIGVVGAEVGADLALVACAGDPLCDGLALITPTDALGVNFMSAFLPRPLWIAAAESDAGYAVAVTLEGAAPNQIDLFTAPGDQRGAALAAAEPAAADALIAFLAGLLIP